MLDKLAGVEARYDELNRLMADAANGDYSKIAEFAKERSSLEELYTGTQTYRAVLNDLAGARALLSDPDMAEMAVEEVRALEAKQIQLEEQLRLLLIPKDPRDNKNVIMEIRAGAGGDEAGIFAADLFRMYIRYADERGWRSEMLSQNETGVGGVKEVIFEIRGQGAYSRLKFESGVHRVQRVPTTESAGRIHTSTATVAVLVEVDEVEIEVPDREVKIDTYRASSAGGQNVQKNATAVRLTHIPSGLVVTCEDERSLTQNRLRAMGILRARLYDLAEQKRIAAASVERRAQLGSGERSEKIRTYNYPQSRVTDHRIGISSFNLAAVMSGSVDVFIDELIARDQAAKLGMGVIPALPTDDDE
jgi:peptide chain release factor 1